MAVRTMAPDFDAKAWERGERDQPFLVEYEGAVLATFEKNGYDDSDFFAVVWDDEKQTVTTTQYATTRGWTYPNNAVVDATDEVVAKVEEWARGRLFERMRDADRAQARRVEVGRLVRLVKGRPKFRNGEKVTIGTEGYVAVMQEGQWGPRLKLRIGDEQIWTALGNVEVVDPEQYFTDETELRERARVQTQRNPVGAAVSLVRTLVVDGVMAAWF